MGLPEYTVLALLFIAGAVGCTALFCNVLDNIARNVSERMRVKTLADLAAQDDDLEAAYDEGYAAGREDAEEDLTVDGRA
jgi:hypothetical protein